ncbi:hypothetical protein ACIQTW_20670 [Paenarthrobacter sp. NPDC090517]|uniref:hypothetical protein n=1 Tax=Paenarthrobacter sp. NPDC090517 TaxID=3364381 RepID=UPI00382FD1E0
MKKPLALIAATALLCAGCAPASNTTSAPTEASPTPSAPVSLSVDSGPQAPGGTVPATIGISWDQASRDQAVDVAQKAMTDFARPKLEEQQWANDLARWLTPQATADYSAVDPANIPANRVTGPAKLTVDEANGYGVTAAVPTDAGIYTLQLLRTGKDAPWKVNRLTPPAS